MDEAKKKAEDSEGSANIPCKHPSQKTETGQARRRNYGSLLRHENCVRELGGKARGIHSTDSGR